MIKLSTPFARFPWAVEQLKLLREQSPVLELVQRALQGLRIGTAAMGGFLFINVIAFYIAISPSYYFTGLQGLIPQRHVSRYSMLFHEIAKNLRRSGRPHEIREYKACIVVNLL